MRFERILFINSNRAKKKLQTPSGILARVRILALLTRSVLVAVGHLADLLVPCRFACQKLAFGVVHVLDLVPVWGGSTREFSGNHSFWGSLIVGHPRLFD